MDRANYALACHLADLGREVHLVAHRVADDLRRRPNLIFHPVPRPGGFHLLGGPLLNRAGRYWARKLGVPEEHTLVNGGNCPARGMNWVHYVHAAHAPQVRISGLRRLKARWSHRRFLDQERKALHLARVIIANSARTRQDLVTKVAIPEQRVQVVYYGIDGERFRPVTLEERAALRAGLGWPQDRPVVAFLGALSDRRKGFDVLFEAWKEVCVEADWDADLVVIGTGAELPAWQSRAADAGLGRRIRFLGFRRDVAELLRACDALAAPARYEAYGLGVHEALCCGLPAIVSARAGVAERYPPALRELLLPDPEDAHDLAACLRRWRARAGHFRSAFARLAGSLRTYTWSHMAARIVRLMDAEA
ncbi:MAG: glycosyltransferase family 4 protein [Planctomycetes bacterium]|nr:glycosyltransferase family 4 protein [Planctomycetota bacterium]